MAWVVYKLAHGANFFVCSELFAIGKSITSSVFLKFVVTMNDIFKKFISWLIKVEMCNAMENFNLWCGSSNVDETIDNIHI